MDIHITDTGVTKLIVSPFLKKKKLQTFYLIRNTVEQELCVTSSLNLARIM